MRPEVASESQKPESHESNRGEAELTKAKLSKVEEVVRQESAEAESYEVENMEMTDEEKKVLNLLNENSPIDLNELKAQAGLSNKKWDKAIKGLTKNKLARVEKTDEGLLVELM